MPSIDIPELHAIIGPDFTNDLLNIFTDKTLTSSSIKAAYSRLMNAESSVVSRTLLAFLVWHGRNIFTCSIYILLSSTVIYIYIYVWVFHLKLGAVNPNFTKEVQSF